MKIAFTDKPIENAPAGYVRVRVTEGATVRAVREDGVEWIEIGAGPWADVTLRKFRLICREIVRQAKAQKATRIALQLNKSPFPHLNSLSLPELAREVAENFVMADYDFDSFKSPAPDRPEPLEEILICGKTPAEMKKGFAVGQIVGEGVNACRELANTPGGAMTPRSLAAAAKKAAKGLPIKVTVWGRKEIEKAGMGAVAGVAKGSAEEPAFIVMEYAGAKGKPIVLIGKGVTFDSGGLNIKTGDHMYEMHMDMSGGAAAIAAIVTAAKLGVKKRVVALVPAVENMSASEAMRPGDILRTLSGKTIEVANTDAEGRLILADALCYAKRFNPAVVLDAATLTGSSISALGLRAVAYFANDERLADRLNELGEASGDYLWRMPLWEEYEENIKATFADYTNAPVGAAKFGDVVNAATLLWQFAKDLGCPWAHLDIAPRMTAIESDKLAKGAAGSPVRLFVRFIEQWQTKDG
ncbi:MAG: leucyl aminopeptidase family protein [Patescibacteria group bacterium]|nr:leucyl aminopeptidase family protein [Patescibacteria group bacterium]MDE1943952.1 leucyl aminopeptidase family protein [Patescibacteria group bacterium]MDE1945015.1 leucyl aminopeptidase family protein [Patescibacteria group bacterium]MDE2057521.1 leucyl aminopeptidase family protein [Patescibacteria group bacterium]